MFIPNTTCILHARSGTDMYGKPTYAPNKTILCGIVRLEVDSMRSSIRTDASGSHAKAMEETAISRILVPATVTVRMGDELQIGDITCRVKSVRPRYAISGKVDHFELDLVIGADQDTYMPLG